MTQSILIRQTNVGENMTSLVDVITSETEEKPELTLMKNKKKDN